MTKLEKIKEKYKNAKKLKHKEIKFSMVEFGYFLDELENRPKEIIPPKEETIVTKKLNIVYDGKNFKER